MLLPGGSDVAETDHCFGFWCPVGRTRHGTFGRGKGTQAGADVLYAPGLKTKEEIATVVRSVDCPVNVVMGLQGARLDLAELSAIGVKRVSVGSALSRAALGAFLRAAREMRETGTFAFAADAVSYAEISALFTNE